MLQSIVGPPLKGVADFKSSENPKAENSNEEKKAGSDSFGQVLRRDETKPMTPKMAELQRPASEKAPNKIEGAEQEEQRRPESDEKVEKITATYDKGVEKKDKSSSQRQNAILNFMDSFESEFGVPPTRIVEAMANLQPTDQAEAPEATADKVIGQLGLDDQQEDLAKEMYVGLLAQLSQINQNAPQASPPPKAFVQSEVRISAQEKRQALNDSLDNMNKKFWMNGENGSPTIAGKEDLVDKLTQLNMQEKLRQSQGLPMEEELKNGKFAEMVNQTPQSGLQNQVSSPALNQASNQVLNQALDAVPMEEAEASEDEEEPTAAVKPLQAKPQMKGASANAVGESFQDDTKNFEFAKNRQNEEGFHQPQGNSTKGEMVEKTKNVEKAEFKKTLGMEDIQIQPHLKQDIAMGVAAGGGAQAMATPSKAENEANIRQIMNQAEYLIKKGGGEMKVEMSPEGMGKINMKVLVQDGKVNVQMSAETHEARKTLENGLSDLRNSLAAHKLSMDHIRIDVVSGTNTENSSQNQMNQHQSSRDQTRQFWNTFNQNFGAPNQQRDGFTDLPNLRGYPRRRTDKGLEPVQTASVNKYTGTGKGAGLNLVA
ncbi:MAG TPA: flagellar hook-length control protein FliK [Pseudobdellovibrionaceae bacterium]